MEASAKTRPKRTKARGKQVIDREKWDAMVVAFQKHGVNHKAVSQECSVHWDTAKRAWFKGWADQKKRPWAIPIKDVLEQDKIHARAALAREERNEADDFRRMKQEDLHAAIQEGHADLVESRRKAGKVVRAARDNSIAALVISQKLLKAGIPLADKVVEQLNSDKTMSVSARMKVISQVARFGKEAIEIAQIADEMERKALGEPDKILAVQHGLTMDVEEAKETLKEIAEVMQTYNEGGINDVIEAEFEDTTDELDAPDVKLAQIEGEDGENQESEDI